MIVIAALAQILALFQGMRATVIGSLAFSRLARLGCRVDRLDLYMLACASVGRLDVRVLACVSRLTSLSVRVLAFPSQLVCFSVRVLS